MLWTETSRVVAVVKDVERPPVEVEAEEDGFCQPVDAVAGGGRW
jgi:hypothetical protein